VKYIDSVFIKCDKGATYTDSTLTEFYRLQPLLPYKPVHKTAPNVSRLPFSHWGI